jgi:hypothetical protein
MAESTKPEIRFTVSPFLGTESKNEVMAVRDQTGNQRFLLKLINSNVAKGGESADSSEFSIEDEEPSAVESPDLTPILDPKRIVMPSYDFELTDNDANTIFLVRATKKNRNDTPLEFQVSNAQGKVVAVIDHKRESGWHLKMTQGSEAAFTDLKIQGERGIQGGRTLRKQRTEETGEIVVDRYTILLPETSSILAQVYPGTPREGDNRGFTTSDAYEVQFTDSSSTVDHRLVLCLAETINLVSAS